MKELPQGVDSSQGCYICARLHTPLLNPPHPVKRSSQLEVGFPQDRLENTQGHPQPCITCAGVGRDLRADSIQLVSGSWHLAQPGVWQQVQGVGRLVRERGEGFQRIPIVGLGLFPWGFWLVG